MARWSSNAAEAQHVEATLHDADLTAGEPVVVRLTNGSHLRGRICGTNGGRDPDRPRNWGTVTVTTDSGETELDVLDIDRIIPASGGPAATPAP
jgi:hypothetical protein